MSRDETTNRNPLITNWSRDLGSVKLLYFIIYIFIQLHLNYFINLTYKSIKDYFVFDFVSSLQQYKL